MHGGAEAVELSVPVHFGLDSLDILAVAGALGSLLIKGCHCLLLLVVVGAQTQKWGHATVAPLRKVPG